jgi:hypothetical protein
MKQIPLTLLTTVLLPILGYSVSGAETKPAATDPTGRESALPLSEVVLYSSGVGYFERAGEVEGRAKVDLRFKVDDINDLLKSLVVQDLSGGQVTTVTYGSRDPLTKTLKSFGIDLTDNPTLGQLLNQVRGERAEVMWPGRVVGTILGIERKVQPVGENKQVEIEYLNLLTEEGLQSISIPQIQRIKLLNERLNTELRQALEVLATSHDTQKKTVGISFEGQGKRKVSVAYIAQTPVWKTSYRLVLEDKEKPYLQGWAIVENTSDEDWTEVRLSLVSGRPISFTMDLYQPLYTTRPVIEPELYLSLRPQVYGEAMDRKAGELGIQGGTAPSFNAALALSEQESLAKRREVQGAAALGAAPLARGASLRAAGGGFGGGGGGVTRLATADAAEKQWNAQQSVTSAAQAIQAGELFQYSIKTPVTLARQQSAMLPIVSQTVEGERISIYNQGVQPKHPLNGFRLKNSTALHLMQGPITVFADSNYAGDARIEDLAPGQERLLSYSLDLKTEVEPQVGNGRQDLVSVKIRKGTLVASHKATEEKTYNVKNRDKKPKNILIEHPFRSDWQLVEPKQSSERTRDVYRFLVKSDPDKTEKLIVREERQLTENIQLLSFGSDGIAFYLKSQKISPKVKEALEKVVGFRDRLNQTAAERSRREQRINEISQEQARIRENMARLNQSSELYTRYVKTLDQQETELEKLRQEIESLKTTERKQQQELNDYLLNLEVE